MSLNVTIQEGFLTKEPYVPPMSGEYSVLMFTIGVSRSIKQKDGSYKDESSFFDWKYWTKNPQYWLQRLYTGTHVVLHGEAEQAHAKEGETNFGKVCFVAQSLSFPIVIPKDATAPATSSAAPVAPTATAVPATTDPIPDVLF